MNVFHSKAPGSYHGFRVPRVIGIEGHCTIYGQGGGKNTELKRKTGT